MDSGGNPPEPGEPVVEALNDERVKVRLQLRTEVPLNEIRYDLRWRTDDGLDLQCGHRPTVVFSRPDGTEYGPLTTDTGNKCGSVFGNGRAEGIFRLAGSRNQGTDNNRPDRPLEYF